MAKLRRTPAAAKISLLLRRSTRPILCTSISTWTFLARSAATFLVEKMIWGRPWLILATVGMRIPALVVVVVVVILKCPRRPIGLLPAIGTR
ncbi:hypothetical protein IWX46DRAFT_604619, partial [Phyllosticta citricarpa]